MLQFIVQLRVEYLAQSTRSAVEGSGVESRWGARFTAPAKTVIGAHPASCTMGTRSFPRIKAAGAWR